MRAMFPDWRAPGLSVCLHEHRGGFAFNKESINGLARKALRAGAKIAEGIEVREPEFDNDGAVTRVNTSEGDVNVQQVIVAVGPWVARMWGLLGLPRRLDIRSPDGSVARDQEMWTYWYLQEGEVDVDPSVFVTADGKLPPVLHVDSHAPLSADDGELVTDEQWGIYFKQDKDGVQGGASLPRRPRLRGRPVSHPARRPAFPDLWCAALSHCMERFEGSRPKYNEVRSGGVGTFTADNFPVFDYMRPNVFVIADSNPATR